MRVSVQKLCIHLCVHKLDSKFKCTCRKLQYNIDFIWISPD